MDTHVNLCIGVRGQRVNRGIRPRCFCHHMDQLRAAFAHVSASGKYSMRLQMANSMVRNPPNHWPTPTFDPFKKTYVS